jgi:hypothetical protein
MKIILPRKEVSTELGAVHADHEGLPAHGGHEVRPRGLWLSRFGEVGEAADLVDFHRAVALAPLTPAGQEPGDQLFAAGGRDWQAVIEDRLLLPFQRNTAGNWSGPDTLSMSSGVALKGMCCGHGLARMAVRKPPWAGSGSARR